jgi:glycosyltransferase involved in cell wall biosynthesis
LLLFTGGFSVGGAQTYLLQLLERLDRNRFEPAVACLDDAGPLRAEIERLGLRPTCFRLGQSLASPASLRSLGAAVRWIRAGRFDVVHCWMAYANVFGGIACRLAAGPRLVCSIRGLLPGGTAFHPRPSFDRLHHWIIRRADRLIVNSDGLARFALEVARVPRDRVVCIPNGVDEDRFTIDAVSGASLRQELGLATGDPVIAYVGRLTVEKGATAALEAFLAIPGETARLVLVGDGREETSLRRRASAAGATDRVYFLGMRRDLLRILNAADVFLFPSRGEGSPNALLEAMACARPIVATDVPGVRDLVRHDHEALLAPAENDRALGELLRAAVADRDLRQRLGSAARERALLFRLGASIERYERVYEDVCSGRQPQDTDYRAVRSPLR